MASVFKRGGKKAKGYYYASWSDHQGRRQTKCTRTTDKATAERIANKYETDAALRRDGVIDPTLDAIGKESQRTIEAHLTDYEAKLRTASRTDKHITSTTQFPMDSRPRRIHNGSGHICRWCESVRRQIAGRRTGGADDPSASKCRQIIHQMAD